MVFPAELADITNKTGLRLSIMVIVKPQPCEVILLYSTAGSCEKLF